MRKFTVFTLVLILAFSVTACGRKNKAPLETIPSATVAPSEQVTLPTIDPTMGTNIPDPEIDTGMPDLTDPTVETDFTENTSGDATDMTE